MEKMTITVKVDGEMLEEITKRLTSNEATVVKMLTERKRQDEQWGGPATDDTRQPWDWNAYISGQNVHARAAAFNGDKAEWYRRMINVGALVLAALESCDRLNNTTKEATDAATGFSENGPYN